LDQNGRFEDRLGTRRQTAPEKLLSTCAPLVHCPWGAFKKIRDSTQQRGVKIPFSETKVDSAKKRRSANRTKLEQNGTIGQKKQWEGS